MHQLVKFQQPSINPNNIPFKQGDIFYFTKFSAHFTPLIHISYKPDFWIAILILLVRFIDTTAIFQNTIDKDC
ncbi:hypothetical protein [Escherichia phage BI-EHEC]|nr:hypothetical protein [Escherichia phage BI-EHEC]